MPEIFQMDRVDRIADILYGVAVAEGLIGYGPLGRRVGLQANTVTSRSARQAPPTSPRELVQHLGRLLAAERRARGTRHFEYKHLPRSR
ncbi:hypothetical protein GCM10011608_35000 [Micromonospora sonchi]|uniref:Uncharacterized protein n=1 Tax=Micromonospora sonchi TaxID=1763543 RepID=A0A917TZY4_9ACTN|nr:hypothetical protein [Micromonospora sonchi]GGM47265.1 hypothetical protein GCM10011608_35000 [Micromonospora sonchi]